MRKINGKLIKVIYEMKKKRPYTSNSETLIFQKERWVMLLDLEEVGRFDSSQACNQAPQ